MYDPTLIVTIGWYMEQVLRKVLMTELSFEWNRQKKKYLLGPSNIAWLGRSPANKLQMEGRRESLVPIYEFLEMKLLGLIISKTELGRQILGIYKSLTDSVGRNKSFIPENT